MAKTNFSKVSVQRQIFQYYFDCYLYYFSKHLTGNTMKIMHEQVSFVPRTMLKVKWDDFPHFTYPWHFHSEYEIVFVLKSSGKRFVADSIEPFKEGDITLLGSNLPHFWK